MSCNLSSTNRSFAGLSALLLLAGTLAVPAHAAKAGASKRVLDFSSCAKPQYPDADVKAQHEGAVTLEFKADAQGTINESKVVKSSGFASLDAAARDAIAKCKFSPAKNDAETKKWVPVQYVWTLK